MSCSEISLLCSEVGSVMYPLHVCRSVCIQLSLWLTAELSSFSSHLCTFMRQIHKVLGFLFVNFNSCQPEWTHFWTNLSNDCLNTAFELYFRIPCCVVISVKYSPYSNEYHTMAAYVHLSVEWISVLGYFSAILYSKVMWLFTSQCD